MKGSGILFQGVSPQVQEAGLLMSASAPGAGWWSVRQGLGALTALTLLPSAASGSAKAASIRLMWYLAGSGTTRPLVS